MEPRSIQIVMSSAISEKPETGTPNQPQIKMQFMGVGRTESWESPKGLTSSAPQVSPPDAGGCVFPHSAGISRPLGSHCLS